MLDFIKQTFQKDFVSIIVGMTAFVLVLVITLKLSAAGLILVLFLSVAIFRNSFSAGWLFLFVIVALVPAIKVGEGGITVYEVLLTILALTGLLSVGIESIKLPKNRLSLFMFLFLLTGIGTTIYGRFNGKDINPEVLRTIFYITLFWILLMTFQYFFQTLSRLNKFFAALVIIGALHSLFGLVMLWGGWQTSTGMGISTGQAQNLAFGQIKYRINGFLGDGFAMRVGNSALAPFLLISIPATLGLFLNIGNKSEKPLYALTDLRKNQAGIKPDLTSQVAHNRAEQKRKVGAKLFAEVQHAKTLNDKLDLRKKRIKKNGPKNIRALDSLKITKNNVGGQSMSKKIKDLKESLVDLRKTTKASQKKKVEKESAEEVLLRIFSRIMLFVALIVQLTALVFTFSYIALIVLGLGMFLVGILLRNKLIITTTAVSIIAFSLIFPSMRSSVTDTSSEVFDSWGSHWSSIKGNWFWGKGWAVEKTDDKGTSQEVYNSYFYAWNSFGLLGLLIFLIMIGQYFRDLHGLYRRSDGPKRIWLIVILAIFVELVAFAMVSNTLFFGPAALIFWLLQGAALNLRAGHMVKSADGKRAKLYY